MTEVERLRKTVTSLAAEKSEYEQKHAAAVHQKAELETRRQTLLTQIAEGNEGARRDLRRLDGEKQEADESEQAFGAAGASASQRFESARLALARAEREAATTALDTQIAALTNLDNSVEKSLADLKQASAALFSAVTGVAQELFLMDPVRYDREYGYKLAALIRQAIHDRFEELGFPNTERRPSFSERASARLRGAVEQLRYEALQGDVVPARGEKLYRTVNRITGLRNLDLSPDSLIGLTESEAAEFVKGGSLQLAEQEDAGEAAA